MSTFLLSAICAMALDITPMEVKNDTIDKYLIDGQKIEHFKGSLLEGKTIDKYVIGYKNAGDVVEKIHIIITKTQKANIKLNGSVQGVKFNGLTIVDGKEMDSDALSSIKPEDIAHMEVLKPGSKAVESFGERGKNGVIIVTTKQAKEEGDSTLIFIDGKQSYRRAFESLPPEKIESVTVNKKGGVIYVTTKK